ncbi:MAG: serine hydrolase domain-containing protein [Bryobacterales bacterium]
MRALLIFLFAFAASAADSGLPAAAPEDVGMNQAVLRSGLSLFEGAVARDEMRGAVVLVARKGRVVLHEAVGLRDYEHKLPMERGTLFRMASNTKPVTATAILMLAEEGKLSVDDNVHKYLPSVRQHARWLRSRFATCSATPVVCASRSSASNPTFCRPRSKPRSTASGWWEPKRNSRGDLFLQQPRLQHSPAPSSKSSPASD